MKNKIKCTTCKHYGIGTSYLGSCTNYYTWDYDKDCITVDGIKHNYELDLNNLKEGSD